MYGLTLAMPELQHAALCWNLACTYQMVVNTIQHPQGEEVSDKHNTVAKPEG